MASEHIYKQFDSDLGDIRTKVLEMGTIVEEQISNSVLSMVESDTKLAGLGKSLLVILKSTHLNL